MDNVDKLHEIIEKQKEQLEQLESVADMYMTAAVYWYYKAQEYKTWIEDLKPTIKN